MHSVDGRGRLGDVLMVRVTCRSLGGDLGGTSSLRWEAFRAASNLVQVSQEVKTKHGRSQAARESDADDLEMENGVGGRALMKSVFGRGERRVT